MLEIIEGYKDFFLKKPQALPRAVRGVFNRAVLKRPHLRTAEIAATFMCNSKCVMCSCAKICDYEGEKNRMAVSEYALLGKELDRIGCLSVNVTGGEPLIRDDISRIITALNPKNKVINLITNGINLTREKIRHYSSLGVDSIVVSLDSTREDENDEIRGYKGHFKAVMAAMEWAALEKVKFGLSLTLGDFNFEKVYELMDFAERRSVFLCIAHGGCIGNWQDNDSILLSERNAEKILALIKRYKKMKIDFSANLSLRPGCPAIIEKIFVTPYGDVSTCAFVPISFGNLRRERLPIIWKRMLSFHRQHVHSKTLCLRTYDKDFIGKFLLPIKDTQQHVPLSEHPYFAGQRLNELKMVKAINEIYHDIAAIDYEKTHPEIMVGQKNWWHNFYTHYVKTDAAKKRTLLDIATGTGFIPGILLKDSDNGDKFIGYDLSLGMLRNAKSNVKSDSLCLIQGDGEKLPIKNKTIDILTINTALHHFPNLSSSLKEMDRVVKDRGLVVIGREPNQAFFNSYIVKQLGKLYELLWGVKISNEMRDEINKKLRERGLIEKGLSKKQIMAYVEYNSLPEHRDFRSKDKTFGPDTVLKFFKNYEILEYSTTSTFIYRSVFPFKNTFNRIINRIFKNRGTMFTVLLRKK